MNLQLFLEIGGFVVVIGGLIWSMAFQRGQSETIEKNLNVKIDQHILDDERQVQKLWDWKDEHEDKASNIRLEIQKQIGKIEADLSIHDSQYGEILRLIQSMSRDFNEKMEKLENAVDNIRKN